MDTEDAVGLDRASVNPEARCCVTSGGVDSGAGSDRLRLPDAALPPTPLLDRLWMRCVLLATATWASLAVLFASRRVLLSVVWVIAAGVACGVVVILEQRRPRLSIRVVGAAIGLVILSAVVVPSRSSNDLWSYTMYGRIVTVHDASPYRRRPADYPTDPFLARVSPRWRHTGSVYGPLFVGIASATTLVARDSALVSRLMFQILAALSFAAILVIVWRRTRSTSAVAWLGLNPVFGVIVVNGGHNDALIGLALLVAAILVARGRGRAAGVTMGLAMLIKLSAGLGLIGVGLWSWQHRRGRLALTVVVVASAVVVIGYLPVLTGAADVLGGSDKTVTKASVWNLPVDRILHHDAGRNVLYPLAPNVTLSTVFYISAVVVVLLAVGLSFRAAARPRSEPAVGLAVSSYTMAGEYTFPWYAIWALPLFATRRLSVVAWIVWVQSIVMLAALKLPDPVDGNALHASLRVVLTMVAPLALLAAFVVAAIREQTSIAKPGHRVGEQPPDALVPSLRRGNP